MSTREQAVAAWKKLFDGGEPSDEFRKGIVSRVGDDGTVWVVLSGDSDPSPCIAEASCMRGDRVTVRVTPTGRAYVTSNESDPGVSGKVVDMAIGGLTLQVDTLRSDLVQANEVIATKVDTAELDAEVARIDELEASTLTADSAIVTNLQAQTAKLANVTASQLEATTGYIGDLQSGNITANDIVADHATIDDLDITYAHLDGANIDTLTAGSEWVQKLLVDTELLANDGDIFTLDAVQVNAANITAGTLDVERLIVTYDGEKYLVHVNPQTGTPSYEKLDGDVIGEHTIAADKLVAHSITASEITTQNLVGTGGWINLASGTFGYYSGATFDQAASGILWDGSNLRIKADSLVFSSGMDVEGAVADAASDAATALQTALDGAFLQITSTNGNLFKNGAESTVLQVAVFPNGGDRCDTLAQVRSRFGSAAYIEWKWMHESDGEWGTLLSTDSHLSHDGMWCTVTPADVATKTSFSASLVVPGEGE